jgi:type I restriction enzyme S subunit
VPDDRAFIPWRHYQVLRRHDALPGDLIVAGLGDESHPLGRSCVLPEGLGPAIVKADCFRVRLDQGRLLPAYAAWFLSSPMGGRLAQELARGSTRQRTNLGLMATIRMPVPPLTRQREVASILEGLHWTTLQLSQAVRRQVDLLLERRQAVITAAVTGQLKIHGIAA